MSESYTWRPVLYPELTVQLEPNGPNSWLVLRDGKPIGVVLQELIPIRRSKRFVVTKPWRWRHLNSNQNHGSHLSSREDACSALLFALQR